MSETWYPETDLGPEEKIEHAANLGASAFKAAVSTLFLLGVALVGLEYYAARAWSVDPDWYSVEESDGQVTFRCQGFAPVQFAAEPAPDTVRVLVIGGSNPFGWPERPEGELALPQDYGFIGQMQNALDDTFGEGRVELINLAVNGGSSEDALRMLRRAEDWGADGVLIYLGHNEFSNTPQGFNPDLWQFALYRRFATLSERVRKQDKWVAEPVWGTPLAKQAILNRLRANLNDIALVARERELTVVIATPGVNLKGLDPNWSIAGKDLDMRALWALNDPALEGLYQQRKDVAELNWVVGQRRLEGEKDPYQPLVNAADHDGMPLRATTEVNDVIEAAAAAWDWTIVDARAALRDPGDAPGNELFYDNAHLRPEGARRVGQVLLHGLERAGLIASGPGLHAHSLSSVDATAAALRTARYWLRWACMREYDPSHRLRVTEQWIDRALELRPGDPDAMALKAVLGRLRGDPAPPELSRDPELRARLGRIHPTIALLIDGG